MKTMRRAKRRGRLLRMKRKAKRLYPGQCAGRLANNLTPCSCPMCGNPRRYWLELTLQERRLLTGRGRRASIRLPKTGIDDTGETA